jgi:ABC-type branched-subunit amino acid transport system substrate-binding protein
VGTDNGLVLISHGRIQRIFTPENGLAGRVVTALAIDKNTGDLWIATYGGISRYSAGSFQSYTSLDSGLANDVVYDIAVQGELVWSATATGLSRMNLRTGGWTTFDSHNTPMVDPWPVGIAFNQGSLFVATLDSGVFKYEEAKDQWSPLAQNEVGRAGQEFTAQHVVSIAYDSEAKALWIANGVHLLRQEENDLFPARIEDDMPAVKGSNTLRLHGNELWICSRRGVSVFNTHTLQWKTFRTFSNGGSSFRHTAGIDSTIPQEQVSDVAFRQDDLWVATSNGLIRGQRQAHINHIKNALNADLPVAPHSLTQHFTAASTKQNGYSGNTVNIGFLGPVEGSTDTSRGLAMLHGAQMAIDEANERASQINPLHKTTYTYALKIHNDTALWNTATMEPVKMALDDQVVAVLGSIDGTATHHLLRVATELGFSVLNSGTSDPTIHNSGTPWIMTLMPDDQQQSRVLAKYILGQVRVRRLGILRENARYARIGTEVFKSQMQQIKPLQLAEATFPSGTTDFSSQLRLLREAGVDGVLLWCQPTEGSQILRQMRASGIQLPAFGANLLATSQLVSMGGTATEGFVAVSDFNQARADHALQEFQRRFRYRFNVSPDDYAALAYDGINLLVAAIEKVGPDRVRVMNALHDYQSRSVEGVAGKILFDESLSNIASPMLARVEGGAFAYWMPVQGP